MRQPAATNLRFSPARAAVFVAGAVFLGLTLVGCPSTGGVFHRKELKTSDYRFNAAPPPSGFSEQEAQGVDALARALLADLNVPGCVVGVVQGPDLVYARAFGDRTLAPPSPAETTTVFNIASLTKTMTATLILQLADRGALSIDDPVLDHLSPTASPPTWRGEPAQLTLRHLLTHTSGLPKSPRGRKEGLKTAGELEQALGQAKLAFAPGTGTRYSNIGYGLLGIVAERVTGLTLEDAFKQELWIPLGMHHTSVTPPPADAAALATHYWPRDVASGHARPRPTFGEVYGHVGAVSRLDDLARYVAMQMGAIEGPVSPAALERLQTPQYLADGSPALRHGTHLSLGWRTEFPEHGGGVYRHSGQISGHSSFIAFSPRAQIGVVVLANSRRGRWAWSPPHPAPHLGQQLQELLIYPRLGWSKHAP